MARRGLPLRMLLIGAAAALVLAACGSDVSGETSTSDAAAPTAPSIAADAGAAGGESTSTSPTSTTRAEATTTSSSTTTSTTTTSTTTTTTTTQPPTTTTAAPVSSGSAMGPIGVVGCSNTGQAVEGYLAASSVDKLVGGEMGGGSLPRWGNPGNDDYGFYWGLYDGRRPSGGYNGAWVQICMKAGEHGGVFDGSEQTWLSHVVEQIHSRDPGIPIWISPLNFYGGGQVCSSTGADGPAITAEAADWAAAALAGVQRGPDLGPLLPNHIGIRDDCHPNGAGEALLGGQLVAFFD